MQPVLKISNLTKEYQLDGTAFRALNEIKLTIPAGSFTTVVGKSGSGKTTLLRIIAGLEKATTGEINYLSGSSVQRPAFVFQEARLLPWLTVEQNIAFPLQGKLEQVELSQRVKRQLQLLGLTEFAAAYPAQISGGMAQRAALGRALIYETDLILMDEPLGALDAFNRRKLQEELQSIFAANQKTVIFVTHDVEEAIFLGEKVIVLDEGQILAEFKVPITAENSQLFTLKENIITSINS